MWSPQVKSFKNNSILVYDLLGHGKTPLNKKNVNFEDFSNQLNNLLNNLNIDKINLVGFSFGSLIAVNFAILGGSMFLVEREYTFIESPVYGFG